MHTDKWRMISVDLLRCKSIKYPVHGKKLNVLWCYEKLKMNIDWSPGIEPRFSACKGEQSTPMPPPLSKPWKSYNCSWFESHQDAFMMTFHFRSHHFVLAPKCFEKNSDFSFWQTVTLRLFLKGGKFKLIWIIFLFAPKPKHGILFLFRASPQNAIKVGCN